MQFFESLKRHSQFALTQSQSAQAAVIQWRPFYNANFHLHYTLSFFHQLCRSILNLLQALINCLAFLACAFASPTDCRGVIDSIANHFYACGIDLATTLAHPFVILARTGLTLFTGYLEPKIKTDRRAYRPETTDDTSVVGQAQGWWAKTANAALDLTDDVGYAKELGNAMAINMQSTVAIT